MPKEVAFTLLLMLMLILILPLPPVPLKKVNFTPEQATKAQRGSRGYSSTLSLTSALDGVGGQRHALPALPLERPGANCTGGWVGPWACLDGCGKFRPHQDSIPGPSSP